MKLDNPIVSVKWLKDNLHLKSLIILDASILKIGSDSNETSSPDYIPKSYFFDLKNVFSDASSSFPNAVPTQEQFEIGVRKLGVNNDSIVIVYDNQGIYSSPRAWWLFRLMGFDNVAVLNGGLPAWKKAIFQVEKTHRQASGKGNFIAELQKNLLSDLDDVLKASENGFPKIIDARSSDRFNQLQPESRKGLRSGTIPKSINFPYKEVLNGFEFLDSIQMKAVFNYKVERVEKNTNLIFSCGSGVTACILAIAAEIAEYKNYSVYDGSWTEYGTLTS